MIAEIARGRGGVLECLREAGSDEESNGAQPLHISTRFFFMDDANSAMQAQRWAQKCEAEPCHLISVLSQNYHWGGE